MSGNLTGFHKSRVLLSFHGKLEVGVGGVLQEVFRRGGVVVEKVLEVFFPAVRFLKAYHIWWWPEISFVDA